MSEELDATAALAYETYRQASQGTIAGGLPMPVWEHVSVPERAAWLAVAGALTVPPDPPAGTVLRTQADLEVLTVSDLREIATEQAVHLPSGATKQEIIDALLAHQVGQAEG